MLLPMSPTDAIFLLGETREHPMHVGGLVLLQPADGADAWDLRAMLDAAMASGEVSPKLRRRARRSVTSLGQWGWEADVDVDLGHHVRHSALPQPGGMAELMDLVSRLHAGLLDRSRPLWEMHLIEGLADGRLAVYTKIHHALADGVSAMRMLRGALSPDPDVRGMPAPWEPIERASRSTAVDDAANPVGKAAGAVMRTFGGVVGEVAGMVPALVGTVDRALHERGGALSLAAPRSMFNVPIGGARRFAARSWRLERLRLVAKHADATVNDVVLAMCAGALRGYLDELDELPAGSLVAMVPVSLRGERQEGKSGNEIGLLTCSLATDRADPVERLVAIGESMRQGKDSMRTRTSSQILAMSALGAAPLAMGMMLGRGGPIRPANVMISNVPGPATPLYWNGARMTALYPLSIPVHGQALNITCTSTDDEIAFGLTGCRRSVPALAPLLGHLDDELVGLEEAFGL